MLFSYKKIFIGSMVVLCAFTLGMRSSSPAWAADASGVSEQAKVYTCVMHRQVVSDKPGNCPICGMRLVLRGSLSAPAKEAMMVEGRASVSISETKRKQLGIRTAPIEEKELNKTIDAWGTIAHDPELYKLQVEYLQAARAFRELERDRTVVAQRRSLTPREQAQIKLTNMGLSAEWIKSLEDAGAPDHRLLFHHDEKGVWVYLDVQEQDVLMIKKNDPVVARVLALPGVEVHGTVEFIDEMVEEKRTVRVRVLVDDVPQELKPGLSVEASIRVDLGMALAVPENAPLFAGKETLVFVDKEGVFEPHKVILGRKADGYYEVKEGLMKGEKVAVGGNFFIDSESRLASGSEGSKP